MTEHKGWQEGQDPEKHSRWQFKDGRRVSVEGIDWFRVDGRRIELFVENRSRRARRSVAMSRAGFWKRVERQL